MKNLIEIGKNIVNTNWATVIVSFISCLFLYIVKEQINERFKAKLPVPVPIELIVVVVGTLVSYLARLNENYRVIIIGELAVGYLIQLTSEYIVRTV